jgi:hypothetical protein
MFRGYLSKLKMAEEKRKNATIFTNNICDRLVELFERQKQIKGPMKLGSDVNDFTNLMTRKVK